METLFPYSSPENLQKMLFTEYSNLKKNDKPSKKFSLISSTGLFL
jgi:hypothetical protein